MNPITETRRKLLDDGYKFIRTGDGDANNGGQYRIKICGGDDKMAEQSRPGTRNGAPCARGEVLVFRQYLITN